MNVIEKDAFGLSTFRNQYQQPIRRQASNFNNGAGFNRPNEVGDPNKAGPVAANPGCAAPARDSYSDKLVQSLRI